jgi:hypothetical protein
MKTGETFYLLFLFMAIVSCKQGIRKSDTSVDLSDKTGQYSQLVLDNIFESELHFPSEYRVDDLPKYLRAIFARVTSNAISFN